MTTQVSADKVLGAISLIKKALFRDESTGLLKFRNGIITIERVDEQGCIWFQVDQPYQDSSGFRQLFPVQLAFYDRQLNCQVVVEAQARIARIGPDNKALLCGEVLHARLWRFSNMRVLKRASVLLPWYQWLMAGYAYLTPGSQRLKPHVIKNAVWKISG